MALREVRVPLRRLNIDMTEDAFETRDVASSRCHNRLNPKALPDKMKVPHEADTIWFDSYLFAFHLLRSCLVSL